MKLYLVFGLILTIVLHSCCQSQKLNFWQEVSLDKNNLYLVFRGTSSKEGRLVRQFNLKDSLSSHVGILLFKGDKWYVYHVLDNRDEASDLLKQPIDCFFNSPDVKINYASIWSLSNSDSILINKVHERLGFFESECIEFDRRFSLKDSDQLYCSEFIYELLSFADPLKLKLKPTKIELTGIYAKYFKQDSLEYIPVDAFQSLDEFIMRKDWIFK